MAITLRSADRFPVGTSVSAYPSTNLPLGSGAPPGSVAETATVATDGTLTFTTLMEDTSYIAYASVGGRDTYVRFRIDDVGSSTTVATGGVFRGAWAPSTAYRAHDTVTQGGVLYAANADFTSAGSFSGSNWTAVVSGGGSASLAPTAVKTANYTAAASDLVPVDASAGSVTVTLPTTPSDKTQVAVKLIAVAGTNTVTIARGGSDVFNKAGGSTSLTLSVVNQAAVLQYAAGLAVWYVVSTDVPLASLDARYTAAGSGPAAWAASTAVTAGQLLTYGGALYSVLVSHTTPANFSRLNLRRLSPEPPSSKRARHLPFMRDTRILDPASSTLGLNGFVQPEQIVRDPSDGSYWCATTFTNSPSSTNAVASGWLHCPAGSDPRNGGNWVETGQIIGLPTPAATGPDAPCPFRVGGQWYVLYGGKATGAGIRLYKSAGGVNGTYSLVGTGDLIPVGTTGTWDVNRVTEPCYFRLKDGTHVIYYMGFNTGNVNEQIGLATCPSGSNIETPGNWTKAAGNPVVPVGSSGADDEQITADPTVIECNGVYWMLYCGGANTAVANAVVQPQMLATSTDGLAWTKKGVLFDYWPLWPADPAPNTLNNAGRLGLNWRGHFFQLGPEYDNDVLWPYGASYGSFGSSQRRVQARMAVIPQGAFGEVPAKLNNWIRLQSDSTDSRVTRTGSGWTLHTNALENGGTAYFSATAGDRLGCYFDGTGIRVRGHSKNNLGTFNVYLDGTQVATAVDCYQQGDTSGNYWSVLMVERTDLPGGQHYIEIEATGNKNAASSGASIFVDYFEILPTNGA